MVLCFGNPCHDLDHEHVDYYAGVSRQLWAAVKLLERSAYQVPIQLLAQAEAITLLAKVLTEANVDAEENLWGREEC